MRAKRTEHRRHFEIGIRHCGIALVLRHMVHVGGLLRLASIADRRDLKSAGKFRAHSVRVGGLLLLSVGAAFSPYLPVAAPIERTLLDLRMAIGAIAVPTDSRIAVVEISERTLERTNRRSPIDRHFLGALLGRLDAMRPTAIGLDILLDQPSDRQADLELETVLAKIRTPTFLAFTSAGDGGRSPAPWQERYLLDFLARLHNPAVLPASIDFPVDPDGVIRRLPIAHEVPAPLSVQLARAQDDAYALPSGRMRTVASKSAAPFLSVPAETIVDIRPPGDAVLEKTLSNRIILIGANLTNIDQHRTPFSVLSGDPTPGVLLHAAATAQIMDGQQAAPFMPLPSLLIAAALVAFAHLLGGIDQRTARSFALLATGFLLFWAGNTALVWSNGNLGPPLPIFGPTAAAAAAFAAGVASARSKLEAERRFINSALVHYVSAPVIKKLRADPAALRIFGEKREITALFTDVADFTSLAERLEPYLIARLLNEYLEGMTQIVHRHQGTLDKYTGDSVIALWGAPLDDPEQAVHAFDCAIALADFGDDFAAKCADQKIGFGRTRVGVHKGQAVVGNFGSQERYQYTAIGDTMNIAARLESANRFFGTRILVSVSLAESCADRAVRPVAELVVRGRAAALAVFAPVEAMAPGELAQYCRAYELMAQGDAACAPLLQELERNRPEDRVVAYLATRAARGYYSTRVNLEEK